MKLVEFLRMSHKRWKASSPAYFKAFTKVTLIIGLITSVPEFIAMTGLPVPPEVMFFVNHTVSAAAFAASLISKLTVEDPEQLKK